MKQLAKNTAIVIATLLALALLWYLRGAVLTFMLALALAAALRPLIDGLVEQGWRLPAALTAAYIGAVGLIVALLVVSVPALTEDVERFGHDLSETYDHIKSPTVKQNRVLSAIAQVLPDRSEAEATVAASPNSPAVRMLLGISAGAIGFVVNLAMALVLSIYWNYDRVHFERLWLSLLSVEKRSAAREVWQQIDTEIGAYLRSEFVQAIVAGFLLYFGARLFNQPYPALLAVIGAVAWMIPWLGGLITLLSVVILWIPTVILGSAPSLWVTAAPMALFTVVALSFLEFVLEPRLFDRRRYNPLLIVLVSIGLADAIGIGGFLIGPPLASAIQIVLSRILIATSVTERRRQAQSFVPLAERLAKLQNSLAGLPEKPPKVASLVSRLSSLLDDAEKVTPEVVGGPVSAPR